VTRGAAVEVTITHQSHDGNTKKLFSQRTDASRARVFLIRELFQTKIFFIQEKTVARNGPVTKQHSKPTILRAGNSTLSRQLRPGVWGR
jgi:hypothetical protein